MDFDSYVDLITDKSVSDEYIIGSFVDEYALLKDGHLNNLPLIALYQGRYQIVAAFLLKNIFNLNIVNITGETILTVCLKRGNSQLAIEIIDAGYSNFDVTIGRKSIFNFCAEEAVFYPVLTRIMAVTETTEEQPPTEFKFFEPDYFQMGEMKGEGGYGVVKMAIGKDDKCYALKSSIYSPKSLSEDAIREINISKVLNQLYPKATSYVYGIYKDANGIVYVVTEYLKHTLQSILNVYAKVPNDIKKEFYMRLFKNLTETLNMINKCGICHFDLKPANIMLDSRGYIRIIDFGISRYLGLEKYEIRHYLQTWVVKAPDDVVEKFPYNHNGETVFTKTDNQSYRVDYSSDMFAIATIIMGSILSEQTLQLLITRSEAYIFLRADKKHVDMKVLSKAEKEKIDSFSPHLWDFLVRVFTVNSGVRLTCKEALQHPFFSGIEMDRPNNLPYSITDIETDPYLEKFVYNHFEISNRLHELKYLQEIIDTYISFELPKSEIDQTPNFKKWDDINKDNVVGSNYDECINTIIFSHSFEQSIGRPITKYEKHVARDIFNTVMRSGDYEHKSEKEVVVNEIIKSRLCIIPFNSIIIGVTTLCRENGENCTHITSFFNNSYKWLYRFVVAKRDSSINLGELFDIFMNKSKGLSPIIGFEWIYEIIDD